MNPLTHGFYPALAADDLQKHNTAPHSDYVFVATGSRASAEQVSWTKLDAKFRQSLPDTFYVRRLAYRAVLIQSCASLRLLDGLRITAAERERIQEVLM